MASTSGVDTQAPTPGTYAIDPGRSRVRFDTPHMFGLGLVHGTFDIDHGEITVAEPVTGSTAEAVILAGYAVHGIFSELSIEESVRRSAAEQPRARGRPPGPRLRRPVRTARGNPGIGKHRRAPPKPRRRPRRIPAGQEMDSGTAESWS